LFKTAMAYWVDEYLRTLAKRLESLQGGFKGRRCFIMGNGPSLNRTNLDLLEGEYVWGTNRCYLLFDRIRWRPSFFVSVDTRVVPDIASEVNLLPPRLPQTTFFFPHHFRAEWILRSAPNVYWYREVLSDESNLPYGMFTQDASKWVSSVKTVTIAALQLAVYLGFDPIYLIGCDTSYSISSTVKKEGLNLEKFTSTKDDDPNHFDPQYFGKGRKWHPPRVDRMLFHFEQARSVCESMGVEVFNATVGGHLEVFPRVDYLKLF
jgi:hypothetical protein